MISLRVLGPFDLIDGEGKPISAIIAQPKRSALLVYLALARPAGMHRRDSILALFWPDSTEERARNSLNQALSVLRRCLPDVLLTRGLDEVGIDRAALQCDVADFETALDSGRERDALKLYRGDLLPGFNLSDVPDFERWLDAERVRLRSEAVEGAMSLSIKALAEKDMSAAKRWAARATTLAPDDERVLRGTLEALDKTGDRAGAMRSYQDFARQLRLDYQAEPSPETRALVERIRSRQMIEAHRAEPERITIGLETATGIPRPDELRESSPFEAGEGSRGISESTHNIARRALLPGFRTWLGAAFETHALTSWTIAAVGIAIVLGISVAAVVGIRSLVTSGGVPLTTGTARQVTNDRGIEITPALSPDGKLIAYAGGSAWLTRIYVRAVAGGDPIEVAEVLKGDQRAPAWAPDASRIVFKGERGIYAVPALGGVPRLIVTGANIGSPTWSHDGKSLAFARANGEIVVADANGENARTILRAVEPHSLAWSPDDSRIAYVVGNGIYVFSRTQFANIAPTSIWTVPRYGGKPGRVTDDRYMHLSPVWSPDSRALLFVSNKQGGRDIYYQPLSPGGEKSGSDFRLTTGLNIHGISLASDGSRLAYAALSTNVGIWGIPIPAHETSVAGAHAITSSNERIEDPAVSADGKWLAFDSDRGGTAHIYRVSTTGGPVEQLTSGPTDEFNPHWSPDGTKISYQAWINGTRDAYVTPVDRFAPRLIFGGATSHEYTGVWSPDGSQLVVVSNRSGRYEFYVVPSGGGSPRQVTTTGTSTFTATWSPDGRFIAYGPGDSSIVIVPASGGAPSVLAPRLPLDSAAFAGTPIWSKTGDIYSRILDREGNLHIGAVRADGSNPRILVRFDKPELPAYRAEFDTDGKNFFFTIARHEADIWVMDLVKK